MSVDLHPPLQETSARLRASFLQRLESDGHGERNRATHRQALERFAAFCAPVPLERAGGEQVEAFMLHLEGLEVSRESRAAYRTILSRWLEHVGAEAAPERPEQADPNATTCLDPLTPDPVGKASGLAADAGHGAGFEPVDAPPASSALEFGTDEPPADPPEAARPAEVGETAGFEPVAEPPRPELGPPPEAEAAEPAAPEPAAEPLAATCTEAPVGGAPEPAAEEPAADPLAATCTEGPDGGDSVPADEPGAEPASLAGDATADGGSEPAAEPEPPGSGGGSAADDLGLMDHFALSDPSVLVPPAGPDNFTGFDPRGFGAESAGDRTVLSTRDELAGRSPSPNGPSGGLKLAPLPPAVEPDPGEAAPGSPSAAGGGIPVVAGAPAGGPKPASVAAAPGPSAAGGGLLVVSGAPGGGPKPDAFAGDVRQAELATVPGGAAWGLRRDVGEQLDLTLDSIRALAEAGQVGRTDMVRKPSGEWVRASELRPLRRALGLPEDGEAPSRRRRPGAFRAVGGGLAFSLLSALAYWMVSLVVGGEVAPVAIVGGLASGLGARWAGRRPGFLTGLVGAVGSIVTLLLGRYLLFETLSSGVLVQGFIGAGGSLGDFMAGAASTAGLSCMAVGALAGFAMGALAAD